VKIPNTWLVGDDRCIHEGFAVFTLGKLNKSIELIPIIIDDDGPANLPLPLRRFQWVDFRGPFEPALRSLLVGIRDLRGTSPLAAPTPKSKGYVFISYANEDAEFVAELKLFLKKQGYGYWDYRESQRDYQADYTLELENIIKDAAGILAIRLHRHRRKCCLHVPCFQQNDFESCSF
jgi:hypothetical protein